MPLKANNLKFASSSSATAKVRTNSFHSNPTPKHLHVYDPDFVHRSQASPNVASIDPKRPPLISPVSSKPVDLRP